jgi:hypothetical protein
MSVTLLSASAKATPVSNKNLVDERLWSRLVNRIVCEHGFERPFAERIMDQALAFLSLCAEFPGHSYAPSTTVDIGWHTFILYTREYADFCQRLGGRFIHHAPADNGGIEDGATIADTVAALKAQGISVDGSLWLSGDGCGRPCEAHECRSLAGNP